MPQYSNGRIPDNLLVRFDEGWNATDGNWYHALSPGTLAKHRALVARAKARTGRELQISRGWSAYRPYDAQILARKIHGIGAADPGTSSHGGFWEGRQTLAIDYGNWAWVYENHGGRAAFYEDVRAVGLTPGMIEPSRGYPDEPWHVIDLDPWSPPPSEAPTTNPSEEDNMTTFLRVRTKKAAHFIAVGNGILRHFIATDPYEKIMRLERSADDWQDIEAHELDAYLYTRGIDIRDENGTKKAYRFTGGGAGFEVFVPVENKYRAGGMWSAINALRFPGKK